jgi:hypothetical protein
MEGRHTIYRDAQKPEMDVYKNLFLEEMLAGFSFESVD